MINVCLWLALVVAPCSGRAVDASGASLDHLIHVWRSEDGLPHNAILSLAQTPDGYIWIGTRSGGLARFDGLRFVTFNPQNTPELHDVEIETLSLDADGTLWILTGNESITSYRNGRFKLEREERAVPRWHGIAHLGTFADKVVFLARARTVHSMPLNGTTNSSTQLKPGQGFPRRSAPSNHRLYAQSAPDKLWYLSQARVLCSYDGSSFSEFDAKDIPMRLPLDDICLDQQKHLWIANNRHLARMDNGAFTLEMPTNGPAPTDISRIIPSGPDSIWVCETTRLRRMQGERWVASAPDGVGLPLPAGKEAKVFGDHAGGLWCLSEREGLFHVQPDGQAQMLTEAHGLPSRSVTSWLEDDEGNIWVGSIDGGLARIRPRLFEVYDTDEGLPDAAIQSVCEDIAGTIWVGTVPGQLAKMVSNRFEYVTLDIPHAREMDCVTVFPSQSGHVWVGGQGVGLFKLLPNDSEKGYQIERVADPQIRLIMEDQAGRMWIGNGGGLRMRENDTNRPFGVRDGFGNGFGIGGITQDKSGTIWIGTGPGRLWKYRNNKFTEYAPPQEWAQARFSAMLAESEDVIWIGTLGGGLVRFSHGKFTRVTTAQGLPNDFITQLLDDEQGHLWAGTYSGIFRVDKTALNTAANGGNVQSGFIKFGRYDGLPTLECSGGFFSPASWRARDGRLWFATLKGLVSVNPAEVNLLRRSPPVLIEEMQVDNAVRNFEPASAIKGKKTLSPPLQIEPGRHGLQFRYTAFNYTAPDDIRFRYKMEGYDPAWHEANGERSVNFFPLGPGDYRFCVQAANSSGLWTEEGATLAFTVLPFFWETWWFKTAVIIFTLIALCTGVGLSVHRRYRLRLERVERQHEMERERARIARDLHDDLGTNLTQISLLSALVSRESTPQTEVVELTKQIRSKSRQMASGLNEIVWAVNPRNDSLNDVLGYFGSFAADFLSATAIRCRLDLPDHVSNHRLSAEARHNLYLAFKEALNNAAKYSAATEITIVARETEREVEITVRDNGRGFTLAQRNSGGNGLQNMRERMEKIHGQCEIDTAAVKGTSVKLRLPK